jgi:hypothetical protein
MCIIKGNAKILIPIVIENFFKRAVNLHEIVTCKQKWNYKVVFYGMPREGLLYFNIDTYVK